MRPDDAKASVVTFHRAYPGAIPPMRAERSALGTIPAAALQYCEALCSASAFGWYIFPPADIRLKSNGVDVFHEVDGSWEVLTSVHLPDVLEYWNEHCPASLKDKAPPFLSTLFVPGVVQIWSGMLVSSRPSWSVLIRPPVNVPQSRLYSPFEGIVETDRYGPAPLFTNVRLMATDVVIELPRLKPLFQVQPIPRAAYADAAAAQEEHADLGEMSADDWAGYAATIRAADPAEEDAHKVGGYAVGARKRSRRDGKS